LKKRLDPLWEIVGEKVYLQGAASAPSGSCPQCHVLVELPREPKRGERFRCGLCGTLCEVVDVPRQTGLVARQIFDYA
jgi:hypothetical protein